MRLLSEADAAALVDALTRHLPWTVTTVEAKPGVERPAPPFTTSTLTQEASRKLGFSTERTMQAAQRLFQGGGEIEGLILSPHRFDDAQRQGAGGVGARHPRDVRRRLLRGAAPLRDEGEERAGSARGDPPDRLPPRRRVARGRARRRRSAPLRADLEAHDGVADGRRARAAHDGRDHRRGDERRAGGVHRHRARRSSSPASAARTSKAATIPPRSSRSRRRCCPTLTVGERVDRDASARA